MYLLHSTLLSNLLPIVRDKKLRVTGKRKGLLAKEDQTDQIFTQIIYKGIPYEADQYPYLFDVCFVLDIRILKDFPFYGVFFGGFSPSFKEGMRDKKYHYIQGKGGYQRLPSLTKLKKLINETFKKRPWLNKISFSHSHEILLGDDIPLKKYCLGIIIDPTYKISRSAKKMIDHMGIPIVHIGRDALGLDNFIDAVKSYISTE